MTIHRSEFTVLRDCPQMPAIRIETTVQPDVYQTIRFDDLGQIDQLIVDLQAARNQLNAQTL